MQVSGLRPNSVCAAEASDTASRSGEGSHARRSPGAPLLPLMDFIVNAAREYADDNSLLAVTPNLIERHGREKT